MVLYLAELSLPHCLDALHSQWPSHPLSTPARFIIATLPSSPSCNDASLASGFGQDNAFILIHEPCLIESLGPPFLSQECLNISKKPQQCDNLHVSSPLGHNCSLLPILSPPKTIFHPRPIKSQSAGRMAAQNKVKRRLLYSFRI